MLHEHLVRVFFYGSYINFEVLTEVNLSPAKWEVARLPGFDISIKPRANLVRSDRALVYGIVAQATHAELTRLYTHAQQILGEIYLPEAVLVETLDGKWMPAMTYICPAMEERPAEAAYVNRIAGPARRLGFPSWYVDRIEGFLPA